MKQLTYFEVASGKIDRRRGIIKGCAVITVGEAKGHGMRVDITTLEQVKDCADEYIGGLAVRFAKEDHGGGAANIVGNLRNWRIEENVLRADLHLLKSHQDYELVMEMAATMPEAFGLSIVFSGQHKDTEQGIFARCTKLYGCDVVKNPAANPTGLFSQPDIHTNNGATMAKDKNIEVEFAQTSAALKEAEGKIVSFAEQVKALTAERDELKTKFDALTAENAKTIESLQASATEINALKEAAAKADVSYKELEASFPARLAAELAKVGQPPVELKRDAQVEPDLSKLSIGELVTMKLKITDPVKAAEFHRQWISPKLQ